MSTDLSASFNEQFMNINMKMKKRFLRKPNISEATNEFIALAIQCEHSEQPAFAGHAYIGAAKCEATSGNFLGEAEQYLAAARQFMKAEMKLKALKFYSPDRENEEAAIGCFMQALNKYPEKSPLRVSILMELADNLITLDHKSEAVCYYEQALDMVTDKTRRLMFLRNLLQLQIDCENFDTALETANTIVDSDFNIPEDILAEIQVNRILLTILVKPTEEKKPKSLQQLLINLMNDTDSDDLPLNMNIRLKLQFIIISESTNDLSTLIAISADASHFLTMQQVEMLQKIISQGRLAHLALT